MTFNAWLIEEPLEQPVLALDNGQMCPTAIFTSTNVVRVWSPEVEFRLMSCSGPSFSWPCVWLGHSSYEPYKQKGLWIVHDDIAVQYGTGDTSGFMRTSLLALRDGMTLERCIREGPLP